MEHQENTSVLLNAFIVHLVAKMEADAFHAGADSDSDDSDYSDNDNPITEAILKSIEDLYKERYTVPCWHISKTQENVYLLLHKHHMDFPNIFQSYTHVTLDCFDNLVNSIKDHPVFHSNSNNQQMPIDEQVANALYWFGHYNNAVSTMKVLLWGRCGLLGYGTVRNITIQVMTAICDP